MLRYFVSLPPSVVSLANASRSTGSYFNQQIEHGPSGDSGVPHDYNISLSIQNALPVELLFNNNEQSSLASTAAIRTQLGAVAKAGALAPDQRRVVPFKLSNSQSQIDDFNNSLPPDYNYQTDYTAITTIAKAVRRHPSYGTTYGSPMLANSVLRSMQVIRTNRRRRPLPIGISIASSLIPRQRPRTPR